jgi:hypothetical protein
MNPMEQAVMVAFIDQKLDDEKKEEAKNKSRMHSGGKRKRGRR